nr:MAG TPA: hypothetical protein [Bacteriophage sp.]
MIRIMCYKKQYSQQKIYNYINKQTYDTYN